MRRRLFLALKIAGALVLVVALAAGVFLGPYLLRVERHEADPARGFQADYYLYVSPGARDAARTRGALTLLVQPNNSGTTSDDAAVHRKDAWWTGFERHRIADELGVALLVPAFIRPAGDWRIYTHALDRDVLTTTRSDLARLDLQLLAMVDHAREALAARDLPTAEKFLIQGFSASGMFANRFVALHPERVLAAAAGSPGGWPIAPRESWQGMALPYPAGIADLGDLVGRPFDAEAFAQVPQLIYMGSLDENDSLDFRDGWDEEPAALVDRLFGTDPLQRWDSVRQVHRTVGPRIEILLVEGAGHQRRKLQDHATRFFAEILTTPAAVGPARQP